MGDGVFFAKIIEQGGQRRQAMSNGAAATTSADQIVTPGDDVRPRHVSKLVRLHDAGELHEVLDRVFIGTPSALVSQVGKPFDFWLHLGQTEKVCGGQQPVLGWDGFDGVLGFVHDATLLLIKSVIKSKRLLWLAPHCPIRPPAPAVKLNSERSLNAI